MVHTTFALQIMKGIFRFFFVIILCCDVSVFGQTFTTQAEVKIMGKKDVLQVSYVADNVSIKQLAMPKFSNWMVVSGPDISTNTIVVNGSMKQSTTYTVLLQPVATGKIVVPGATALINDKPRQSNSLFIEVKNEDHLLSSANPPSQPASQTSLFDLFPTEDELPTGQFLKKGESAINKIKNNIVVRLELSKTKCFVGEPILATYKLCTRLKSKSKVIKQPMFSGCTVVELTDSEMSSHIEKINGLEYNVFVIRRVQLIPLNTGALVLPEAQVENKVSFYDGSKMNYRDLFYDQSRVPVEEQTVTLTNKPQTVEVKSLPPAPVSFSGAIGSFNISISTNNQALTTTNNNNLIIAVNGVGNLQNMKPLAINWPKGLEGFEPQENIEYEKSSLPVQVSKKNIFSFIADKKGIYIIPSVPFIYFDPAKEKYLTKATSSLAIQIIPGNKNIIKVPVLSEITSLQNSWYIIAGTVVLGLLIVFFWFNARKKTKIEEPKAIEKVITQKEVEPTKESLDYLFQIRLLEPYSGGANFYKKLLKNIQAFLQEKYGIDSTQIPTYITEHPSLAEELQELKELTEKCNLAMYTPFAMDEAMQDRLKAIEVITKLQQV